MSNNIQYVGARYVPKFANPIAWDKNRSYEALEIVTYLNTSYTSKIPVPAGVDIDNSTYWVVTGNYNAQVESYRQEVRELAEQVENLNVGGLNLVDITQFGVTPVSLYYDNTTMLWWTDSTKSTKPTNVATQIQNALNYCITNNMDGIFFPSGDYYCGGNSFTFNASKIKLVGNATTLISENCATSAFITITSDASATQYNFPTTVMENIKLFGNYFQDSTNPTSNVTGIMFSNNSYFNQCTLNEVMCCNFNNGIALNNGAYKMTIYNYTAYACDVGVLVGNQYSCAIPIHFITPSFNCCNTVFKNSADNVIVIIGGSCEYNRFNVRGGGTYRWDSVRFEFDSFAAITETNTMLYPFYFDVTSVRCACSFVGCEFYIINHFASNVGYWNRNPKVSSVPADAIFCCTAVTSLYKNFSFSACNLTIATECVPASKCLVKTSSYNVDTNGLNYEVTIAAIPSNQQNILSNSVTTIDSHIVGATAVSADGDYDFKAGSNCYIKLEGVTGQTCRFLGDFTTGGSCNIKAVVNGAESALSTQTIGTGLNVVSAVIPSNCTEIRFNFSQNTQWKRTNQIAWVS